MTTVKQEEIKPIKSESFEEKLYNFVMKGEWRFQANAFCDSYYNTESWMIRKSPEDCTYWSIWYGTKSFRWEKITYNEAIKRKKEDLARRSKLITSNCLTDNQKVVVIDFLYQHWVNSSKMKYKANNCLKSSIFFTIAWWRDEYKKTKKW